MATFAIEVPFPNDCAPFKVIRHNEGMGVSRIVDAAQTREEAKRRLYALAIAEAQHAIDEHKRTGDQSKCRTR